MKMNRNIYTGPSKDDENNENGERGVKMDLGCCPLPKCAKISAAISEASGKSITYKVYI